MTSGTVGRKDRARAFVPELIPEPVELDRTGPLDAREQRDLERIHAARDHHQAAKWMRGKSLEAAFKRRLYRGEDGQRTRQQYLDDEWDGISESAAYLEIKEWRLAAQIHETYEQPAPDSHVRALVSVAEEKGCEEVARWYAELRQHGKANGKRVTEKVVQNLAAYLTSGETGREIDALFAPPQLPPPRTEKPPAPAGTDAAPESTGSDDAPGAPFQNFGMAEGGDSAPAGLDTGQSESQEQDDDQVPVLAGLRAAVAALVDAHTALEPTRVAQAREAAPEDVERLLGEARAWARKVLERVDG
ncbi:hypothetical protein [Streptomyces sp. CB03238]|uniref:hypothetical protein n=1 Tax=Streptomyces sp. CB03238 TaxID=1907777 RepID=UPI000A102C71|nr:hypothetical protein [Streptomyces sp. CB03238]ORT54200.1 hypothetical protein BKD26_36010 [Streptomyces sp. CB03238]